MSRNKEKFQQAERDCLINRYVPPALNGIYQALVHNEMNVEEKEKQIHEKYRKENIIDEESDKSDSDEDNNHEGNL